MLKKILIGKGNWLLYAHAPVKRGGGRVVPLRKANGIVHRIIPKCWTLRWRALRRAAGWNRAVRTRGAPMPVAIPLPSTMQLARSPTGNGAPRQLFVENKVYFGNGRFGNREILELMSRFKK